MPKHYTNRSTVLNTVYLTWKITGTDLTHLIQICFEQMFALMGLILFVILFSHSQHKLLYNRLKLTRRNLFYFPVLVTVLTWKKHLENVQVVQRLFLRVFILLLLAELIYFLVTYVYKTAIDFGGHVWRQFSMLLASVTYEKYATRFPDVSVESL